jgi:hypothetical protein
MGIDSKLLENIDIKDDINIAMSASTFSKLGKAQISSLEATKDDLLDLVVHGITDLDRIKFVMSDMDSKIEQIKKAIKLRWEQEKERVKRDFR